MAERNMEEFTASINAFLFAIVIVGCQISLDMYDEQF